ncbi:hypothetical protein V8E52_001871, partial [Russula decolorans]
EMSRAPTRLECRCTKSVPGGRRPGFGGIGAVRFPSMGVESLVDATTRMSAANFVGTLRDIVDAGGVQSLTLSIANKTGPVEPGVCFKRTDGSMICLVLHCSISHRSCSKASLGIVIDDFAHGRSNTCPQAYQLSTLTWKTNLADILPNDWQLIDPWASQNTNLIDILTHVSGVASHDFSSKKKTFSPREITETSAIIALHKMKSRLPGLCVFKPMGMTSSTYSIKAVLQTGGFTNTWAFFGRLTPL